MPCTDTSCIFVCYVRCARCPQMFCACVSLLPRSTLNKLCLSHSRALHGHFVFICLLCPLRSMSANALRLRLSSLAVSRVTEFAVRSTGALKMRNHGGSHTKEKDIHLNVFSLVTLPRFVGRRASDCRNSGASKFTCIANRLR